MSDQATSSLRQIIRASAISGAGSAVFIAVGIVRTKFVALVLGPGGVGLLGLFQSILTTAGTVSAAGIGNSGIRQIAEARADGDSGRLASTRSALVRGSFLLGLVGMVAVVIFRGPIAGFAFGDERYAGDLVILGFGVWCFVVAAALTGLLNGMHRIGDLARAGIAGSLLSLPATLALVWSLRERGVAASVALTAAATLAAAWWYGRRVDIPPQNTPWSGIRAPLLALLGLGAVLMAANLLTTGSQLLARVIMARTMSIDAAGHFQAAWSISMLYLGFALNAMGTDYYPRLTAAGRNHDVSNKLMNEQLQVALTLTGPVILLMLTFAPQVVRLLFSGEFSATIDILRLQLLGDVLKVASWPLAYLLPSRGHGRLFFTVELCWNAAYLGLLWFGLPVLGMHAAGIAYSSAYALYFLIVLVMVRRISGFSFSPFNGRIFLLFLLCAVTIFWVRRSDSIPAFAVALSLIAASAYYAFRRLSRAMGGLSVSRILKGS